MLCSCIDSVFLYIVCVLCKMVFVYIVYFSYISIRYNEHEVIKF